jgi:hypothetical protein
MCDETNHYPELHSFPLKSHQLIQIKIEQPADRDRRALNRTATKFRLWNFYLELWPGTCERYCGSLPV